MISQVELDRWTDNALAGDRVLYHRGMLAADMPYVSNPNPTADPRIAGAIWRLHEKGLVHLVQRRLGVMDYEYFAIARPALAARRTWTLAA